MNYYIFLCNKCQTFGTGQTNDLTKYSYHCFRCNNKQKVHKKQIGITVTHKGPYEARAASLICKELNSKETKNLDFNNQL